MRVEKIAIGISIFLLLTFVALPKAHAQSSNPAPTPSTYELSYPGMLPDNPLYFLKMARDNVMSFFIGNPVDKASFMLLQSDQHVCASKLLVEQKKDVSMIHSSYADAQNYFESALDYAIAAKKEGLNTEEVVRKLKDAGKKHNEVLKEITSSLSEDDQKQFNDDRLRGEKLEALAESLKP